MYEVIFRNNVRKDLKRISLEVRNIIVDEIFPSLSLDPFQGKRLTGKERDFWKYSFSFLGTEYRIIYKIRQQRLMVFVVLVGSRENFYKRLKQRLK